MTYPLDRPGSPGKPRGSPAMDEVSRRLAAAQAQESEGITSKRRLIRTVTGGAFKCMKISRGTDISDLFPDTNFASASSWQARLHNNIPEEKRIFLKFPKEIFAKDIFLFGAQCVAGILSAGTPFFPAANPERDASFYCDICPILDWGELDFDTLTWNNQDELVLGSPMVSPIFAQMDAAAPPDGGAGGFLGGGFTTGITLQNYVSGFQGDCGGAGRTFSGLAFIPNFLNTDGIDEDNLDGAIQIQAPTDESGAIDMAVIYHS